MFINEMIRQQIADAEKIELKGIRIPSKQIILNGEVGEISADVVHSRCDIGYGCGSEDGTVQVIARACFVDAMHRGKFLMYINRDNNCQLKAFCRANFIPSFKQWWQCDFTKALVEGEEKKLYICIYRV